MRSELVYSAGLKIANRFLLATVAIKAVRKLHISTTRTEDTANVVFVDVAAGRYTDVCMPEILPQAAIEESLAALLDRWEDQNVEALGLQPSRLAPSEQVPPASERL